MGKVFSRPRMSTADGTDERIQTMKKSYPEWGSTRRWNAVASGGRWCGDGALPVQSGEKPPDWKGAGLGLEPSTCRYILHTGSVTLTNVPSVSDRTLDIWSSLSALGTYRRQVVQSTSSWHWGWCLAARLDRHIVEPNYQTSPTRSSIRENHLQDQFQSGYFDRISIFEGNSTRHY